MTGSDEAQQGTPRYASPPPTTRLPHQLPPSPPRAPWSLKLAGASWIVAGIALVLVPLVAALLVRSQYLSLRRNGYFVADLAERLDPGDYVQLEPYIVQFEQLEAMALGTPGWLLWLLVVTYAIVALVTLACYLLIGIATARGIDWTRWAGSVLAVISSLVVLQLWQFFAVIAWLPVTALHTNHVGLAAMVLQIAGVVFAFIPPSNAYIRQRREYQRALNASNPHLM